MTLPADAADGGRTSCGDRAGDSGAAPGAARSAAADDYDRWWADLGVPVWDVLLDAATVRPGTRLLDIGCGPGRFLRRAADRGAILAGIDAAERMVELVYLDGFRFGDHTLVGALGVTLDGTKIPVGVVEGSTENAAVCTRLMADVAARGLDATRGVLFVVDGGKAIAKAVDDVYGHLAGTQRCRIHKERNILDHLPEDERPLVRRKLRQAWAKASVVEARADLQALTRSLAHKRPGAAASLREGLEETLTVNRLGVTGTLLRTLASTNPVESMIEIVRDHAHRVKHWSSGDMALRWAAAGMTAAQAQFRRVKGYRQLLGLARALEQAVGYQPAASDVQHAATA